MKKKITVFITDDKTEYRNIIKELLLPYPVKIVGEADDGEGLIEAIENGLKPDVVLLDIEMKKMDGCEALKIISEKFPKQKVIMLSMHYLNVLVDNFIERGASGYLPKDDIIRDQKLLYKTLCKVNSGGIYGHKKPKDGLPLTKRQKQILPKVFEKKTNVDIAKELEISERAVEKQRKKIYRKAGTTNAIDFYKYAFSRGLQYLADTFSNKKDKESH
ncbi:MAG: response regulator transcription factor [Bacteroidia bacterium]|jgi:DNA-binding NarL/FixJ family response regulator|nr:response regulator transcription factor [Bacteroidia bacterium]